MYKVRSSFSERYVREINDDSFRIEYITILLSKAKSLELFNHLYEFFL